MGFAKEVKQAAALVANIYKISGDEDKIGDEIFYDDIRVLMSTEIENNQKIKKFIRSYQKTTYRPRSIRVYN